MVGEKCGFRLFLISAGTDQDWSIEGILTLGTRNENAALQDLILVFFTKIPWDHERQKCSGSVNFHMAISQDNLIFLKASSG